MQEAGKDGGEERQVGGEVARQGVGQAGGEALEPRLEGDGLTEEATVPRIGDLADVQRAGRQRQLPGGGDRHLAQRRETPVERPPARRQLGVPLVDREGRAGRAGQAGGAVVQRQPGASSLDRHLVLGHDQGVPGHQRRDLAHLPDLDPRCLARAVPGPQLDRSSGRQLQHRPAADHLDRPGQGDLVGPGAHPSLALRPVDHGLARNLEPSHRRPAGRLRAAGRSQDHGRGQHHDVGEGEDANDGSDPHRATREDVPLPRPEAEMGVSAAGSTRVKVDP